MIWRKAVALILTTLLVVGAISLIDQPVARLMARNDPAVVDAFKVITRFGEGGFILYPAGVIIIIAMAIRQLRPSFIAALERVAARTGFIFACVATAGLAADVLKIVFGRTRPPLWLAGDESGFAFMRYSWKFNSFPSGHTTTSFAAAVAFSALFPRWRIVFFAMAGLIAVSRLALDAHYPSDVFAGGALGITIAVLIRDWAIRGGWLARSDARDFGLASNEREKNTTKSD